jgi:hypothetical protein
MRQKREFADAWTEPETEIVVAGDWHSNTRWIPKIVPRIREGAPNARTLIHVGDFNIGQGPIPSKTMQFTDAMFETTQIARGLIVLGNHDDWSRFRTSTSWKRGVPHQLNDTRFYAAPRPYVLTIGGRRLMLFGGAASLQRNLREGSNFWKEEVATPEEYESAGRFPGIDVLLTHEAPNGATSATAEFEKGKNPGRFPADRIAASQESRRLTSGLSDDLMPAVHFHGHLHAPAEGELSGGRHVISLGQDEFAKNLVVLHLPTLTWRYI